MASNIMYIRVRLDARNVREIVVCSNVTVIRKARCRCSGSRASMC